MNALRFSGKLNRIEFLVSVIGIGLVSYLIQRSVAISGVAQPSSTDELLRNIILAHAAIALVCLPFFVCRLRDIGWPIILSAIIFVPHIPQALFWFHLLTGGEHASYQLATYYSAINYAELFVLAFVLLLLLWPGRNHLSRTAP